MTKQYLFAVSAFTSLVLWLFFQVPVWAIPVSVVFNYSICYLLYRKRIK